MEYAIETHQLTRFFGDFCAVDASGHRREEGDVLRVPGPQRGWQIDHDQDVDGSTCPVAGNDAAAGRNPAKSSEVLEIKRRIGVVPEDLALFENLTAREHLTFVGRMYLLPRQTIRQRIDELLSLLQLEDNSTKLILEYSHGMRKKVALAAALLPDPDLLFLDEPFEGVDAVTSRVIRDLLVRYVARGSTVFLTSHVLEIVERLCTHVGIIVQGKLVEQEPLDQLRHGRSLEDRFLELVGSVDEMHQQLSWLSGEQERREGDESQAEARPCDPLILADPQEDAAGP